MSQPIQDPITEAHLYALELAAKALEFAGQAETAKGVRAVAAHLTALDAENAALKDSSSDLLAAAKQVAQWVEQRPRTHPYDTWKALNAAIAKMEGK